MDTVNIGRRRRPDAVAADKGYSYPRIRAWLSKRAIEAVIPNRSNQPEVKINKKKYRGRNVIERCIGWLKWCRRVATRSSLSRILALSVSAITALPAISGIGVP